MVLTQRSPQMSNTFTNNNLNKLKPQNFDWNSIQIEMKNKLGNDIYESWLKKINFVEEFKKSKIAQDFQKNFPDAKFVDLEEKD